MPRKAASAKDKKQDKSVKRTSIKQGDKVEWDTLQGKTKGKVKHKISKPTKVKGHEVRASESGPQYLVESEKTGKTAAHQAKTLKKVKT